MTAHKIFDGAFVMYSDMHLKECTPLSWLCFFLFQQPVYGDPYNGCRLCP